MEAFYNASVIPDLHCTDIRW